uniref:Uncharacterized protein n=1 Tax=Timema douglasi TaxID=61478 RepID=A0A7R8VCE5_TIMDO|nr:unnamed protein product [Timema douglasi]
MDRVRLDSANVFLPGLKTAPPPLPGAPPPAVPRRPNSPRHEIFQLCVCSNGKLFLASPEGVCAADDDSVVCRVNVTVWRCSRQAEKRLVFPKLLPSLFSSRDFRIQYECNCMTLQSAS